MASISSLFAQTSSYETFVTQLVELESQKKLRFEAEQSDVKESKTAVGVISSALTDLEAKIKELTTESNNSFELFSSSVSESTAIKINSVSGLDRENTYNITTHRLAQRDIALDTSRVASGTDLAGFGDGSVTLTIGDKTETISVSTTGLTNKEILDSFVTEISNAFGEEASANVFNTDSDNIQFSIQSLAGFDNHSI